MRTKCLLVVMLCLSVSRVALAADPHKGPVTTSSAQQSNAEATDKNSPVMIFYALRNVPAGDEFTPDFVRCREMNSDSRPTPPSDHVNSWAEFNHRFASKDVAMGEVICRHHLEASDYYPKANVVVTLHITPAELTLLKKSGKNFANKEVSPDAVALIYILRALRGEGFAAPLTNTEFESPRVQQAIKEADKPAATDK